MAVIKISTLRDLQEWLYDSLKCEYIYRGISKEEEIYPKILRENCVKKELDILGEFEHYFGIYTTATNFWEFISAAQHYGLMTRLIDFTSNPYVALFFSLHAEPGNDTSYKVYCLSKGITQELSGNSFDGKFHINSEGHLIYSQPTNKNSFTSFFEYALENLKEIPSKTIYTLQPNTSNNRLLMQQGLFVFPIVLSKKEIKEQFDRSSTILEIEAGLRGEVLQMLDRLGYNEFRLMPDLDNTSREINKKYRNSP